MVSQNIIRLNAESSKKAIDPRIYSNFIEHIGHCIHNGLWSYEKVDVPMCSVPRLERVREDVLEAVKSLKISVLRAFGGCYSDVYHWKDAIGPREKRKHVKNKYWGTGIRRLIRGVGQKVGNQFGTDEFITFCQEIGAEPYLNVNYGTGTPQEAAEWVEYCNGEESTEYGALRVKYGRKKPYNVQYWGIANEIFGFWEKGYEKYPENYAKKYLTFAKAMREKDPTIKLIACGCFIPGWNQTVLKLIGEEWVDFLSIHHYLPGFGKMIIGKKHPENKKCYNAVMASQPLYEKDINDVWEDITIALGKETHVRIAFDEWGMWYKFHDLVYTNNHLLDGIWTALMILTFQRFSEKCPMANWSELVNVIGGPIQTRSNSFWKTPIYLALKMMVDHSQENVLESVEVKCQTFNSQKYSKIPKFTDSLYISCNATIDNDGNDLSLILINKHYSDDLNTEIQIKNFNPSENGELIQLNSHSPYDYNTVDTPDKIQVVNAVIKEVKLEFSVVLPAHSVSILKLHKA